RARSYARAAENLLTLVPPLGQLIMAGKLEEIPGVGKALAEVIRQLQRDGTTPRLEAMRAEVPRSVLELLAVPGLEPRKVLDLYRNLQSTSIDEVEEACRQDRFGQAKGFGSSFQRRVLDGIELMRRVRGQQLIHHAGARLDVVKDNLRRSHPELTRIVPAGE